MSDVFHPVYSHRGTFDDYWNTKPVRAYYRILRNQLRQDPAEQAYRQRAYEDVGRQQMAANQAVRANSATAFGMNNPTGFQTALMAQNALMAPYGAADLAAREAGRQSSQTTGQALLNAKQMHANWYSTLMGPWLQMENIEAQKQIAAMQAAAAAAAASGGGG